MVAQESQHIKFIHIFHDYRLQPLATVETGDGGTVNWVREQMAVFSHIFSDGHQTAGCHWSSSSWSQRELTQTGISHTDVSRVKPLVSCLNRWFMADMTNAACYWFDGPFPWHPLWPEVVGKYLEPERTVTCLFRNMFGLVYGRASDLKSVSALCWCSYEFTLRKTHNFSGDVRDGWVRGWTGSPFARKDKFFMHAKSSRKKINARYLFL